MFHVHVVGFFDTFKDIVVTVCSALYNPARRLGLLVVPNLDSRLDELSEIHGSPGKYGRVLVSEELPEKRLCKADNVLVVVGVGRVVDRAVFAHLVQVCLEHSFGDVGSAVNALANELKVHRLLDVV